MKRAFLILLALVLMMTCCITGCAANTNDTAYANADTLTITMQIDNPVMAVNGVEQSIDDNQTAPKIINDRTLVPVRAVIEAMGGTAEWDADTQTATLTYSGDEIRLVIDSTTAYLNDAANELDAAPTIINDRTMLPIRFIAESFGFDVEWDGDTETVTITGAAEAATEPTAEPTVEPTQEPEDEISEDGGKVLIVYYSATGTTEKVANIIADALGGDLFEIVPVEPYTDDDLDWTDDNSRVTLEHDNELLRDVELVSAEVENWDEYDTVFIGYPIWWGIAAWPVNNFVKVNDFTGKTVIPFCTSSSSGIGESGDLLEEMTNTGTWLEGERLRSSVSDDDILDWIEELGL
ncbi:MAG: hypothetical protein LUF26_08345 [Firmicutes bacterium]|nr:hypothetical protein [Bacillota bacterium]